MVVRLTLAEVTSAATAGLHRKVESIRKGHKSSTPVAMQWDAEIEGALAECAYCKAMGIYWSASEGSYKDADVGNTVQIRHTVRMDGSLIFRHGDNPDHVYVLIVGTVPTYKIVGSISGHTIIANHAWRRNPNNMGEAWFVPQSALSPIGGNLP